MIPRRRNRRGDARPRNRRPVPLLALLAIGWSASALISCSLPPRLAAVLFEGVPPPGKELPPEPVVRQPRRPVLFKPPPPPAPVKVIAEKPVLPDWDALYKTLPREEDASVDWDDAFAKGAISPRPGIDPKAQAQTVFDYDVELVPAGLPAFKVVFPHKPHTQWLACANCHTEIFQMKKGGDQITMAKVLSGEFCGRCHGKVSFALTSCARCHVAMPK